MKFLKNEAKILFNLFKHLIIIEYYQTIYLQAEHPNPDRKRSRRTSNESHYVTYMQSTETF